MEVPETRYAERPDGVAIAYQVFGQGPRTLVYVPGFVSHLDLQWTDPGYSRFMRRLGGFARVVLFDKAGTGLSDPLPQVPSIEERAADVGVVMDAAGADSAVVMGFSEGAAQAVMFAATCPARVEALVLYGGVFAAQASERMLTAYGLPEGIVEQRWREIDEAAEEWGTGKLSTLLVPSLNRLADKRFFAVFERAAASPRMARALLEVARKVDVLDVVEAVRAPTLLLHAVGDFAPVEASRYVATKMPDVRLIELPGDDHAFWTGDADVVADEIEQFVTGARHAVEPDRMLATVLFTDLVGSTARAAELGDAAWRRRLEAHHALVERQAKAFRGRVVKAMGDGHLCVFDGPARALRCALAIRDEAAEPVRAGVHTGECEVIGDDVGGIAVHIGARIGALAGPGEVLASNTVKDLVVGSPLAFADRGEHELKGVPGTWRLHAVGTAATPPPIAHARELRPSDRVTLRAARRAPVAMSRAGALARRFSRTR